MWDCSFQDFAFHLKQAFKADILPGGVKWTSHLSASVMQEVALYRPRGTVLGVLQNMEAVFLMQCGHNDTSFHSRNDVYFWKKWRILSSQLWDVNWCSQKKIRKYYVLLSNITKWYALIMSQNQLNHRAYAIYNFWKKLLIHARNSMLADI